MEGTLGFYRTVMNHLNEGVYFVDVDRKITFWNSGAEKISGYNETEVLHKPCFWNILMHQNTEGIVLCENNCPLAKTLLDGILREETLFLRHKQGYRVPVSARSFPIKSSKNQIVGAVQIFADMTPGSEQTKKLKALATLAYFDLVTGLANRRYVESRLGIMLAEHKKTLSPFGMLVINLMGFKALNDKYGPEMGDQILRTVARNIAAEVGPVDIAARWDGTRFIIIIPNTKRAMLILLAEKIKGVAMRAANSSNYEDLTLTVSIAGTINRPDDTPVDLQRRIITNLQESELKAGAFVMDEE
jgi:diguanylate cyclase (GGDEF)-like protein/PAS domain S-box-containing protein